ncbi:membrane protein insertase YidC, partial [Nocardia salmonicida]|uniref:membrane protein insertase YidC n=1 Tax=Nocardia salmonicida TaxID=53431 RepID=UPI00365917BE
GRVARGRARCRTGPGCLPVLVQVPVFLGLFHVLRSFNRTGTGWGQIGMSNYDNAHTANYIFSATDVQSFLSARIFGAPIAAFITAPPEQLEAFADWGGTPTKMNIALVAVPLMIIAGLATHFNARASVQRQTPEAAANPQAAIMNKLSLWVFPLGVMVGGPFLMIGILLYWVANNIWTYGQQHLVFGRMEKEDEERKQKKLELRAQNAPKPGVKPVDVRKKQDAPADDESSTNGTAATNGTAPKQSAKQSGGKRRPGGQQRPGNRGRANQKRKR